MIKRKKERNLSFYGWQIFMSFLFSFPMFASLVISVLLLCGLPSHFAAAIVATGELGRRGK